MKTVEFTPEEITVLKAINSQSEGAPTSLRYFDFKPIPATVHMTALETMEIMNSLHAKEMLYFYIDGMTPEEKEEYVGNIEAEYGGEVCEDRLDEFFEIVNA